jgi:RNA polymerase sigma-70 factor (ECF subfamily)
LREVFVRALKGRDTFRHEASPTTWLYRITTNYCLNLLRDDARRREKLRQRAVERPRSGFAVPERGLALSQILSRLAANVCEMAVYSHVYRMRHDEISASMDVSPRTVRNRLREFATQARGMWGLAVVVAR